VLQSRVEGKNGHFVAGSDKGVLQEGSIPSRSLMRETRGNAWGGKKTRSVGRVKKNLLFVGFTILLCMWEKIREGFWGLRRRPFGVGGQAFCLLCAARKKKKTMLMGGEGGIAYVQV